MKSISNRFRYIFFFIFIFVLVNLNLVGKQLQARPRSKTRTNEINCELSMFESDEYFCESEEKWKRRRTFYAEQREKNVQTMNEYEDYFQKNWFPEFQCENEVRLGDGDGGKWTCDIQRLKRQPSCLIYSLGSGRDFNFEKAVREQLPHCSVHTVDMQYTICPDNLCTFHHAELGNGRNGTKTLRQLMNETNQTSNEIDILKIDIEHNEHLFLHTIFSNDRTNRTSTPIQIRQILIEIHLDRNRFFETNALFYLLNSQNYVIYHREPNPSFPFFACEYGFFRLNRAFFRGHI